MQRFLLITGMEPDEPVEWAVVRGDEVAESGRAESLSEVADRSGDDGTMAVILPGDLAATRRLRLPVRREAALASAARLAFEDILATPAEDMHFAFGPAKADGERLVSAVPSEWIAGWMEALGAAGLNPDVVTVDHVCLPAPSWRDVNGRSLIALEGGAMTVDAAFAEMVVPSLTTGSDDLPVPTSTSTEEIVGLLATVLDHGEALNFRRGPYRPKRNWSGIMRAWQAPAALAAACLIVWCAGLLIDGVRHRAAADDITAEATQIFTRAYPGVAVRDLSRQAAARAGDGGTPMLLPLTVTLAEVMEELEAVELTGLTYQAGEGVVADLRIPDAAALDALRERLEAEGIPTDERGGLRREEDGRFAGQIVLRSLT